MSLGLTPLSRALHGLNEQIRDGSLSPKSPRRRISSSSTSSPDGKSRSSSITPRSRAGKSHHGVSSSMTLPGADVQRHEEHFTLYGYWRSSCTYRVRIAMHLKQLQWQTIPLNLAQNEHVESQTYSATINTTGNTFVPTLVHCGKHRGTENHEKHLTQSLAICEYLDELFSRTAPLLPSDPYERAQCRELVNILQCDTQPLTNLIVLNDIERLTSSKEERQQWIERYLGRGLKAYEKLVKVTSGGGPYSMGSQISLADVVLMPTIYNARRFKLDLASYPTVISIVSHLEQVQAFKDALPENQVDAPKAT